MSHVSAPTKEAVSTKGTPQDSAPTQKTAATTVIEHVLSRLKDLGISKVFGVAGDFAFPIEDAIVGFPGIDWVGCCHELNHLMRPTGTLAFTGSLLSTRLMV